MKCESPGYRARNMDVDRCNKLNSDLCDTADRIKKRKDCPQWLIQILYDMAHQADCLTYVLKQHRDEIPPTMEIQ
jgi:hypothetical protein